MADLGFGRMISRASQTRSVPLWVYGAGIVAGLAIAFFINRK